MAARRYVHRHLDSVALMKTLGATRAFTLTVSLTQLAVVGLAALTLGPFRNADVRREAERLRLGPRIGNNHAKYQAGQSGDGD